MPSLILQPTPVAQWQSLLQEAQQECALRLPENIESYLVFLLMRFTNEPSIAHSVLGLEFLNGFHAQSEQQRQQVMKDVGDKCLLFAGLFPARAIRKRVKITYFIHLGQTAYANVAEAFFQQDALYPQLCQQFTQMMDLLHAMRSPLERVDLLQSFELWHETGNLAAWERLCQATNALPHAPSQYKKLN